MNAKIIPFVRAYENGKTGSLVGQLGWHRFNYSDIYPGIIYGLSAGVHLWLSCGLWIGLVQQLREKGFLLWNIIALPFLFLLPYLAYSFGMGFCYWLGVQRSIFLKRKRY